ncbi:MAG: hypothetical protein H7Y86_20670 [Rhizobacter sp.]|nr:hypothetical protein [Ferruginibacter sp.]
MKSIATTIKKAAFLPLICLSFICFGQIKNVSAITTNENGRIEFVRSADGNVWFKVNLANIPASGCSLQITNQANEIIFEDHIKGDSYQKTFKISNEGLSKLNFDINGKKYKVNNSFDLKYEVETKLAVTKI